MTAPIQVPSAGVPIRSYRDFWDVPRMFVAESEGRTLLFDCAFDDDIEDYANAYRVYLMPSLTDRELEGSWAGLPGRAIQLIGTFPVANVRFDATNRAFVDGRVIASLIANAPIPPLPAESANARS